MGEKQATKLDLAETQHWLYVGVSQSGKTTLARWHARRLDMYGHSIIVYDPVRTATKGGDWPARARVYQDYVSFIKAMQHAKDAYVFVDEGADVFSHSQVENQWLLRRGRHRGLYLRVMSQRPKMIAPNARTQCTRLFMFRLSRDDARELCADFGHGSDVADVQLDTGDFLVLKSGAVAIEKSNCFRLVN